MNLKIVNIWKFLEQILIKYSNLILQVRFKIQSIQTKYWQLSLEGKFF